MTSDIQLNVDLAIAKALDSDKVPGFTDTNWNKALLTHIQVGNTTQTRLLVAAYEGEYVDVTKHLTGDLDVLPKQETWDELKKRKYKTPTYWLEGDETNPEGSDTAGGTWFAVKSEIEGSRGDKWTYEFDKQVWAGTHQGAPFTTSSAKDAKPSADDWAREFGLYPRRDLPTWAKPIVASAPNSARCIPPLVDSVIGTDWSSLRTVVEEEGELWLRFKAAQFKKVVTKALGDDWGAYADRDGISVFHAKDDFEKAFLVAHDTVISDNPHVEFAWAWADEDPEKVKKAATARELFDYGVKNSLLDLTFPSHRSAGDNRPYNTVSAFATTISKRDLVNYKVGGGEILFPFRLLTEKDASRQCVSTLTQADVNVELPALTFEEVYRDLRDVLQVTDGVLGSDPILHNIGNIIKNVSFLAAKENLTIKVDGNKATLTEPPRDLPPLPTNEEEAANYKNPGPPRTLTFEQTDDGYSYSQGTVGGGW